VSHWLLRNIKIIDLGGQCKPVRSAILATSTVGNFSDS